MDKTWLEELRLGSYQGDASRTVRDTLLTIPVMKTIDLISMTDLIDRIEPG
jgi:hypothetical protein